MPESAILAGDDLRVLLDGENAAAYQGWKTLRLERPIDSLAGSFALSSSVLRPWPFQPGAAVRIELADEVLLAGHVEELSAGTSARGREVKLAGRDRAGDMVDCAAVHETGEWRLLSLIELAQELAEPFGLEVESRHSKEQGDDWLRLIEPFQRFTLRSGETAWSALERALRTRGFLGFTEGGRIQIERPGPEKLTTQLVESSAGNILSATLRDSTVDRFSSYTVRSQRAGSDEGWGETVAEIEGTASDTNVARFRPWLDFGEAALTFETAQERASWEASVRAARAKRVEVQVQGWRQAPGLPAWRPNRLVDVHVPSIGLGPVEMLIARVRFERSERGSTTTLELRPSGAFNPAPAVAEDSSFDSELDSPEWSE